MDENTEIQQSISVLKTNVTQAQIVAADPSAEPELLRFLALFTDQKTRQAVAGNPNTPADVLLQLGAEFPSQLLDNPIFPLLLLENLNLVAEIPLPTLRSILRQENIPEYILEQVADQLDLEVQLALANNVKTPKGVLNRLTQSKHSQVVESARLHINVAGELTDKYQQRIKEVILGISTSAYKVDTHSLAVLAQVCPIPEFIIEHWVKNSRYYNSLCRELADSPATFPSILKHLANHTDAIIRMRVAQNAHIPVETIRKLASEQGAEGTQVFLARNLSTPSDVLESLSKDKWEKVRISVATHPNTPPTVLKDLANDTDRDVVQTAAWVIKEQQEKYTAEGVRKNPKTPTHVLEKLAKKHPRTICEHPNTPLELLLEFSKSDNSQIRGFVAENPRTPIIILEQLAYDDSTEVRWNVAQNPNTPLIPLFKQLARDAWVSYTIAYQMSTRKYDGSDGDSILDILAEESTSSLETILQRLVRDGGEAAHLFLARRIDLPADILALLAEATEVKVRETAAQNLNTPISALEKLARDPNSKTQIHAAANINISPEILEELAVNTLSHVREKAMVNPSLPKEAVERILCGEYANEYLKLNPDFLSHHPDSKALVINYYAMSESPWVSFIALNQPQISQELLQEKSLSISWLERLAVAQNSQTVREILNQLAKDSNQLVRAAAKDTLQNLS